MSTAAHPRSCASCDMTSCALHIGHGPLIESVSGKTSWLLDDAWPEYSSYLARIAGPDDQILAPGLFGAARITRYDWAHPATSHTATLATARRHWSMRRVATAAGSVRQQAYATSDKRMATALAKAVDYRSEHLVIAQAWLPWLDRLGLLGGRSFDVLMSRYPLADIHARLDAAARDYAEPPDPSIADFRAPDDLVEIEQRLLVRARRIVSPHDDICTLFADRATRLAWHRPAKTFPKPGQRTAFIGTTLPRDRPDLAAQWASRSTDSLIIFASASPDHPVWQGSAVEHRPWSPSWLDDIGTIVHPATMTTQPRRLLQALANGVTVHATPACGLPSTDYCGLSASLTESISLSQRP